MCCERVEESLGEWPGKQKRARKSRAPGLGQVKGNDVSEDTKILTGDTGGEIWNPWKIGGANLKKTRNNNERMKTCLFEDLGGEGASNLADGRKKGEKKKVCQLAHKGKKTGSKGSSQLYAAKKRTRKKRKQNTKNNWEHRPNKKVWGGTQKGKTLHSGERSAAKFSRNENGSNTE